jgi:hypothetical protein
MFSEIPTSGVPKRKVLGSGLSHFGAAPIVEEHTEALSPTLSLSNASEQVLV